jgi:hypothetical protein
MSTPQQLCGAGLLWVILDDGVVYSQAWLTTTRRRGCSPHGDAPRPNSSGSGSSPRSSRWPLRAPFACGRSSGLSAVSASPHRWGDWAWLVSAVSERGHDAIAALPDSAWTPAIDVDGDPREHAAVAELTGLLPVTMFADYPNACASSCAANDRTPEPSWT